MNTLTQTMAEPEQAFRFKSIDDIINALPVARRRAIRKESRRMVREMKTSRGMRQSRRDTLMWYADWIRQPYHDVELENDMAGAWVLIESMKIGPEFLAQEMWSLPAWQRVVQLHFVKKIQRNPHWKFALKCRPAWLDDGIWIENRRKHFASRVERSRDRQVLLLRLAQQLCSRHVARK